MVKIVWNYTRTVIFYFLGILNTIFIRPEDVGTWKHYLGYILLVLAVVDTIFLVKKP
ncbi:hypothetical protein ACFLS9_00095 [Bacteroidota bacterium]